MTKIFYTCIFTACILSTAALAQTDTRAQTAAKVLSLSSMDAQNTQPNEILNDAPSNATPKDTQTEQAPDAQMVIDTFLDNSTDTPTLLQAQIPTSAQFDDANAKLLAQNSALTRQVDDLQTQVNVLVQERATQFYVYGVLTCIICTLFGALLGKLFKKRW